MQKSFALKNPKSKNKHLTLIEIDQEIIKSKINENDIIEVKLKQKDPEFPKSKFETTIPITVKQARVYSEASIQCRENSSKQTHDKLAKILAEILYTPITEKWVVLNSFKIGDNLKKEINLIRQEKALEEKRQEEAKQQEDARQAALEQSKLSRAPSKKTASQHSSPSRSPDLPPIPSPRDSFGSPVDFKLDTETPTKTKSVSSKGTKRPLDQESKSASLPSKRLKKSGSSPISRFGLSRKTSSTVTVKQDEDELELASSQKSTQEIPGTPPEVYNRAPSMRKN